MLLGELSPALGFPDWMEYGISCPSTPRQLAELLRMLPDHLVPARNHAPCPDKVLKAVAAALEIHSLH